MFVAPMFVAPMFVAPMFVAPMLVASSGLKKKGEAAYLICGFLFVVMGRTVITEVEAACSEP